MSTPPDAVPDFDFTELLASVPTDDGARVPWARDRIVEFADRLRAVPPTATVWTFGPDEQAWSWMRRGAIEMAIHRWDAEGIEGPAAPIDAALAADGIDELVSTMWGLWASFGAELPQVTVRVRATDCDREWTFGEPGGGDRAERTEGTASDLLLALWGRATTPEGGDGDGFRRWAALSTFSAGG
jgi:uncharacterized protein (TIGR03083 family)